MKQAQMLAQSVLESVGDTKVAERIKSGISGDFKPVAQTVYQVRELRIVSGTPMAISIAGFPGVIRGRDIVCRNTENPLDIEATIGQPSTLLQSSSDKGIFFLGSGEIGLSGKREFKALKDLNEKQPEAVRIMPPKSDPDEIVIDGKVSRQVGSVCVKGEAMLVIL